MLAENLKSIRIGISYFFIVTYFIEAKQRTKYIYKHTDLLIFMYTHTHT